LSGHELRLALADERETRALGGKLATTLDDGLVVFLSGDLGAGKTCLVRGVLQALGFKGAVKSPTYTLVEDYSLAGRIIYHFDLYRLHDPEELDLIGVRDYFDGQACCFVEWPEKGEGWLPMADLEVHITHKGQAREARLTSCTDKGSRIVDSLQEPRSTL
jgi:tRNA threonylcarbamoyladenosine biosynthesis protein TsaE